MGLHASSVCLHDKGIAEVWMHSELLRHLRRITIKAMWWKGEEELGKALARVLILLDAHYQTREGWKSGVIQKRPTRMSQSG